MQSIEVTHNDEGKSGFQITFQVGRAGLADLLDYSLLANPLLRPFNRVVLTAVFNVVPRVLMDGIITNRQLSPGDEPGAATLTVTGEDVSVMMDLKKVRAAHPAQDETVIALKLIASYAQYGLIPIVIPPIALDLPIPIERIPVQQGTDLEYLNEMAKRYGYVFYVNPGPAPLTNIAYWGPPQRIGVPQRALSVNMGPETNVSSSQLPLQRARADDRLRSRPGPPAQCDAAGDDLRQPAATAGADAGAPLPAPERAHFAARERQRWRPHLAQATHARRASPIALSMRSSPRRASSTRCATATFSRHARSSGCAARALRTTAFITSKRSPTRSAAASTNSGSR